LNNLSEQHDDSFIFEWTIALNMIGFSFHVITFGFCVTTKWFPPLKCKPDSLVFQINDPPLCSLTDWLLGCFQVTFAFEQLQPINPSVILPDNQSSIYALHFSVISKSLLLMQINKRALFLSDSLAAIDCTWNALINFCFGGSFFICLLFVFMGQCTDKHLSTSSHTRRGLWGQSLCPGPGWRGLNIWAGMVADGV